MGLGPGAGGFRVLPGSFGDDRVSLALLGGSDAGREIGTERSVRGLDLRGLGVGGVAGRLNRCFCLARVCALSLLSRNIQV